ncbi:MAG: PAS domain S-box protein [Mariprofundaceae bacterium]
MSLEEKHRTADLHFSELERKAEELVQRSANPKDDHSLIDTKNLIHQLQVYQVELEIQNEELRESQEALLTSRDRLSHLYHQAPVGYVSLDQAGMIREVNQRLATLLNLTLGDLLNKPMVNFIHPKDRDIFHARFRAFQHSPEGKSMEIRLDCKDHSVCYALLEGRAAKEGSSSGGLLLLTISDITARRDAEANLRLADKIIESAQESILVTDKHGKIINVNPCFEAITGYSKGEVIGKNPSILQSGRQSQGFYDLMWKELLDTGIWQGVVWNKRKNGDEYAERLTISAIYGEQYKEVTHFVGVFTDITDQLELEEQLRQSQKMEAIGTLVGGIAHDFNNMLAGIVGNLYLAKKRTINLPKVTEKLDRIDLLSKEAAKMISQMLTFARKGIVQMAPLSLNTSLTAILDAVGNVTLPANIEFEFDMGNDALVIEADETQLQQVMINLLSNARDAVQGQKNARVQISLKPYHANEQFLIKHHLKGASHFAHLSITDNGHGIAEKDLKHVFEPFYTTKGVGEGTGLGLAMVYGSVQTHGGVIEIESTLATGTNIHIYFPLVEAETEIVGLASEKFLPGKGETILVVDDNEEVREITTEMLEDNGYQTHQSCDGFDTLKLFETHFNEIDLVILDIIMPGMSGGEAAKEIRKIRPDMPILFMTGYDKEHVFSEQGKLDRCEVITKPFQFETLSRALRDMLD